MAASQIKNADLPTSILIDAIAERIGGARAGEVAASILRRLDQKGWKIAPAAELPPQK
jgi:hypothetical protein